MTYLPRRIAALALAGLVALGCAVVACSNQGEGDRCSAAGPVPGDGRPAGSDDCAGNLWCTRGSALGLSYDACCPQDRAKATTATCAQARGPIGDAGVPADGASSTDANGDVSTDAPAEATATDTGTDAPKDAPADAPSEASIDAGVDAPTDAADEG